MKKVKSPVEELPDVFRDKAEILRDSGFGLGAEIWDQAARDAEHAIMEERQQLLTVNQAMSVSGLARRTLTRYLSNGTLQNHGEPGGPRIRRGDLPRKPTRRTNGRRKTKVIRQ